MSDKLPSSPSPNGDIGRGAGGRFAKGNKGGPGNPQAKLYHAYREAFMQTVTHDDIVDIVKRIIVNAKAGDMVAAKIILNRCLGPVPQIAELTTPSGGGVCVYLRDNGRT